MITRALAELGYRLAGILTIVLAVRMFPNAVYVFAWDFTAPNGTSFNRPIILAGHIVPILILLFGGLFLIVRSSAFAQRAGPEREVSASQVTPADLHAVLLSAIGIVLIGLALEAVPHIVYTFGVLYSEFAKGPLPEPGVALSHMWSELGGTLLQVGLGAVLIFKSSNVATLLRRRFDRARAVAVDGRCPHCGWWFEAQQYKADAAAYLCGNCKQELPREEVARRLTGV